MNGIEKLQGGGVIATGQGVYIAQALAIRSALRLLDVGMTMRGTTLTKMLAKAGSITGNKYKRGEHDRARADLKDWCDAQMSDASRVFQ